MKSSSRLLSLLIVFSVTACGGAVGGAGADSSLGAAVAAIDEMSCSVNSFTSNGPSLSTPSGVNVMEVTVNGAHCGGVQYPNEPCTSITVCTPGTETCQTINNILLDTGSYGLRIFASAMSGIAPSPITAGPDTLGECVGFGDGSSMWGPVETIDLQLTGPDGEPTISNIPIQVVDASFGRVPAYCGTPYSMPSEAGFNGILGVGLFPEDCGEECALATGNRQYYLCSGSRCSESTAPIEDQVQNPVSMLPADNNGLVIQMPSVGDSGARSVTGYAVLGIGTRPNNTPSDVMVFSADLQPSFATLFTPVSPGYLTSFIDSGSSALFFPGTSELPDCDGGYFCPSGPINFSATNVSASGSNAACIEFQIADMTRSSNWVFSNLGVDIGGTVIGGDFDWGLPFFYGRNVYIGIYGSVATFGPSNVTDSTCSGSSCPGPFWAY